MSDNSKIQWTDATWPVVTGCTRVSPGCDHCYAFSLHDKRHVAWKRGRWPDAPAQYHEPFSRVQMLEDRLGWPLRWRKPRRIFVPSMGDLFHEDVPDEFIARVFAVMALAPQHTFQILTKRPERMATLLTSRQVFGDGDGDFADRVMKRAASLNGPRPVGRDWIWPLPNVWLGTSVSDQASADERIPWLLRTPAAVRFLSVEPLLDLVNLRHIRLDNGFQCMHALLGHVSAHPLHGPPQGGHGRVDWVIVGGESGQRARPMDLAWAREIVAQCRAVGAPVFVKQLGSVWAKANGAKDNHGGDPEEWPEDLRIRQFPEAHR